MANARRMTKMRGKMWDKSGRRVAICKWWYSFASRSAMSSMVGLGDDAPLLEMSVGFSACRRVSSQSLSP